MEKLKIFVDCHVFDGNFQGTTTYLKGLYTELIKDRTKHFYLAANNVAHLESVFGRHINVTYLKYRFQNRFVRLISDIPNLIKTHKIDYAHFQYVIPPVKRCKYIVTIHDVLFLDFPEYFPPGYKLKNGFLFKWSARRSNIVLTVSEYSCRQIDRHFKPESITVTPNAVDPVFFEAYDKIQIQSEIKSKFGIRDYILYVSRWEPRKNHDGLLRAFAEGKFYEKHELILLGNQSIPNKNYQDYFASLSQEVQAKVKVLSGIGFEDMVRIVRGATLVAYPSFAEGFGIPPLEGIAAQIPTVCSNATAMAEFTFICKGLFSPGNISDMTDAISGSLENPSDSQIKSTMVQQRYSWTKSAEKFLKALENDRTSHV